MTERPINPWMAFAAGAVAMLAIALLVFAWQGRDDAADVAKTAIEAAKAIPDLERPRLPDAPRIPDTPVPRPQ